MSTLCMNRETILASVKNVKFDCYVEPLIVYCVMLCVGLPHLGGAIVPLIIWYNQSLSNQVAVP